MIKFKHLHLMADSAAGLPGEKPKPAPPVAAAADDLAGLTPAQLCERLRAAEQKVATFEAAKALEAADEVIIQQKMAVGLSRAQAQAVIRRQREHDAAEAAKRQA